MSVSLTGSSIEDFETSDKEMPSVLDLPKGCAFFNRCQFADERCMGVYPESVEVEPGHIVACHKAIKTGKREN